MPSKSEFRLSQLRYGGGNSEKTYKPTHYVLIRIKYNARVKTMTCVKVASKTSVGLTNQYA